MFDNWLHPSVYRRLRQEFTRSVSRTCPHYQSKPRKDRAALCQLTPVESTLTKVYENKALTRTVSPLESTLTRNQGGGHQ